MTDITQIIVQITHCNTVITSTLILKCTRTLFRWVLNIILTMHIILKSNIQESSLMKLTKLKLSMAYQHSGYLHHIFRPFFSLMYCCCHHHGYQKESWESRWQYSVLYGQSLSNSSNLLTLFTKCIFIRKISKLKRCKLYSSIVPLPLPCLIS